MITIDLRDLKVQEISFYLALEKYLVSKKIDDDIFFLWDIGKSIIIGKNQVLKNEVNLDKASQFGVKIYRRPSGGGAIFADSGCFMYTFITKEAKKEEVYAKTLPKMVSALEKLGVNATFSGRNDLVFMDKKFSGCAIYYQGGASIIHGTFLYDTNLEKLGEILTPSTNKLSSKGIKSVSSRVVNLKPYLNLEKNELMDYLLDNIDPSSNMIKLQKSDIDKVFKIKEEYDSYDFIYNRDPKYTYINKERFAFGELEVRILVVRGKISDISYFGDFFFLKNLDEYFEKFIGLEFKKEVIWDKIDSANIGEYILDCTNLDIKKIMGE